MRPLRAFRLFLAALIVSAIAGGGLWLMLPQPGAVEWEQLRTGVAVTAPPGEGPFPVAVLLHGCGGRERFLERYAQAAAEAGAAAIILDSYGPRGVGRARALANCIGFGVLRGARAEDIALLLENLDDPRLDMNRVALAGWSAGAWSVTEYLGREPAPRGVRAAFLVYPHCGRQGRWPASAAPAEVTVMAVVPTRDPPGANPACLTALRRAGADIVMVENATHAFEAKYPPLFPYRHDAEAFAANVQRFTDLLRATLTPVSLTQGS